MTEPSPDVLRSALSDLVGRFPTDDDMRSMGWESAWIDKACDAYENARAALGEPSKGNPASVYGEALKHLAKYFPDDHTMVAAGWDQETVDAACDAYANAIEALKT